MDRVVSTQTVQPPATGQAPEIGYRRFSSEGDGGMQVFETVDLSEQDARAELESIALEPGTSVLKLQLAQDGISLVDHSDVGANKRFESFSEKLFHVLQLKMALLTAITMSMVTSGGWGPSGMDDDVAKARSALRGP